MADKNQIEYNTRLVMTKETLRGYYNDCVKVMAQEQAGEIDMETALDRMNELDEQFSILLVNRLAPKKTIIVL